MNKSILITEMATGKVKNNKRATNDNNWQDGLPGLAAGEERMDGFIPHHMSAKGLRVKRERANYYSAKLKDCRVSWHHEKACNLQSFNRSMFV